MFIPAPYRSFAKLLIVCLMVGTTIVRDASAQSGSAESWIVRLRPGVTEKELADGVVTLIRRHLPSSKVSTFGATNIVSVASDRDHPLRSYLVIDLDRSLSAASRRALLELDELEEIFPNHIYSIDAVVPDDSLITKQWGLDTSRIKQAWELTKGSSDVLIGVLDTGIDWEHPDLRGSLWINAPEDHNGNGRFDPWPFDEEVNGVTGDIDGVDQDGNGYVDDVIGYDFVDQTIANLGDWGVRDGEPFDDQGHGTNVSGVIGASHGDGRGVAGIAPDCRIVSLRAFDANGDGEDDDIATALIYAADNGVDIVSMSFGDYYRSPLLADAVRYAHEKGVLLVASSGNSGVPDPHYPSGFEQVMSVGAIQENGLISLFSGFGSQLSLVAPGEGIFTTARFNGYIAANGTSFSAPHVAAVAGLILSLHPERTADELRTSIELTTDERGESGWDVNYGAGVLNAERSVRHPGGGIVEIGSPRSDSGASGTGTIAVIGSIAYPTLDLWELSIGEGEIPEEWSEIGSGSRGVIDGVLGSFDAALLADTVIMIRLRGVSTSGRTIERRSRLYSDGTSPVILDRSIRPIWSADRRAVAITFRTDDLTTAELHLTPADGSTSTIVIEREEGKVGFSRQHYWFVTPREIVPGVPYRAELIVRNAAGLETIDVTESIILPESSIPLSSMRPIDAELPYGFLAPIDTTVRIDGHDDLILLNRFDGLTFDRMMLYENAEGALIPFDSSGNWVPRGFGDVDGDGLIEVLAQSENSGILFEQIEPDGTPFASILFADTTSGRFSPAALHDMNGDGRDELIYYTHEGENKEEFYVVAAWNGQRFDEVVRLPNPTAPGGQSSTNALGASDPVIRDLTGDGRPDFCFGDSDGDIVLYIQQPDGSFRMQWFEEHEGEDVEKMIAAGDLENDGRTELFFAWRPSLQLTRENEYEPPIWQLRGFTIDAAGDPQLVATEEFAYVRSTRFFRTGIHLGDLDERPGDELSLSIFPNAYVFRWDPAAGALRPFWFTDGALLNRPIITDLDADGTGETAVGDGERILFYEADATSLELLPPSGLDGWSIVDSTNFLRWDPVDGAVRYRLYRRPADSIGVPLRGIGETSGTTFVDSGSASGVVRPQPGISYHYLVTALNAADLESVGSERITIVTHAPLRLIGATAISSSQLRVTTSQPIHKALYRTGAVEVVSSEAPDKPIDLTSVLIADPTTLLITFDAARPGEEIVVTPTSLLRDAFGSPADTSISVSVTMPSDDTLNPFIAVRARAGEGKRIILTFSRPLDPASVTALSNYRIEPIGAIISAIINPDDPSEVILLLADEYPLGPFGYTYTISVDGIRSNDGSNIPDGPGSVVGFTLTASDLLELSVFPQPYSLSDESEMTFGGLPIRGIITIHTQSGVRIHRIDFNGGDGGVRWDGLLTSGETLPTGIYLYFVTVLDDRGERGETRVGKFAVVP